MTVLVPLVKLQQKSNSLQKRRIHKTVEPIYTQAARVALLFCIFNGTTRRFPGNEGRISRNGCFPAVARSDAFSKQVKVNDEKWNRTR